LCFRLSPLGKVSLNETPVRVVVVLGLPMVNVSDVTSPIGMATTPNALLIVGGSATVNVAVARSCVPKEDVRLLVVLTLTPAVVPLTFGLRPQVVGDLESSLLR